MVAQFPQPDYQGGASPYGARPLTFHIREAEYQDEVYEYPDGSADYLLWSDTKTLIFELGYDGLTKAELDVFEAHRNTARNRVLGFNFYDWRTSTMYTDVHYHIYRKPRGLKSDLFRLEIELIKRGVAI